MVLPPTVLGSVLPTRLQPLTAHTISSLAALRRKFAQIRQDGVAFDREEHTEGICVVGAMIDQTERVPLADSVPMPTQRFHGREQELSAAVVATCTRLLEELGSA